MVSGVTAQAVLEAILRRRSASKLRPDCPPRELVQRLLEAGVRAPNHHLNQPWRFIVLSGSARDRLGELLASRLREQLVDPDSPEALSKIEAERRKPLRAPVLIVVASVRTEHPKALPIEDVAATAAAVQNMLLAAPALGLGAFWRTGWWAYDPEVKAFFGLRPEDEIVAFLYVGYPALVSEPTPREPAERKAIWRWEE